MIRIVLLSLLALPVVAQDRVGAVQVRVTTDRADWVYAPGQPVKFKIVAVRDGHALSGVTVSYKIGPEMVAPTIDASAVLNGDAVVVDGGTMAGPGFLRCIAVVEVNGRRYRGLATAAFAPEKIQPTQKEPADFDAFWTAGKAALAKLPVDAKVSLLPDYGNALVDCYHVNLQNVGTGSGASRLYGVMCEPKAAGKYPALLSVPGAGVRPYRGLAEMAARGMITLQIGIHGVPVTMDQSVYDSLGAGALSGYMTYGLESKDRYYYRRVYLGCVRANDFLVSHPKWDGSNLAVTGGSQGGALSIVTAGLDPRVKGLAAYYPALSDVTGYLEGRAGGWPHMFREPAGFFYNRTAEKIETSRYYDVVNFAKRVKVPGLYTWGFNDETCPPTTMYSAYNVIPGEKKLMLAVETGHNNVPEQVAEVNSWLVKMLGAKN